MHEQRNLMWRCVLVAAAGVGLAFLDSRGATASDGPRKPLTVKAEGGAIEVPEAWYTTEGEHGQITFLIENSRGGGADNWVAPQVSKINGENLIHPSDPDTINPGQKWEPKQAI